MHDFTRVKNVLQHIVLLVFMALVVYGVYVFFQTPRSIIVTASVLILVHLAAAAGLFYAGRGLVVRFFNKLHGIEAEPPDAAQTHQE